MKGTVMRKKGRSRVLAISKNSSPLVLAYDFLKFAKQRNELHYLIGDLAEDELFGDASTSLYVFDEWASSLEAANSNFSYTDFVLLEGPHNFTPLAEEVLEEAETIVNKKFSAFLKSF